MQLYGTVNSHFFLMYKDVVDQVKLVQLLVLGIFTTCWVVIWEGMRDFSKKKRFWRKKKTVQVKRREFWREKRYWKGDSKERRIPKEKKTKEILAKKLACLNMVSICHTNFSFIQKTRKKQHRIRAIKNNKEKKVSKKRE